MSRLLLGSLGILGVFILMPKTITRTLRRLLFGILSEILAIVLAGYLTGKVVEFLTGRRVSGHPPRPPRHR